MTVEEMIAERTVKARAALGNANGTISMMGGTPSADLSGLAAAIASIPSGGELPELTDPAAAGDILSGKEAIDENGDKLTGSLVIANTLSLTEDPTITNKVLTVEVESSKEAGTKSFTVSVPDALPENIVSGKTILGVPGTAKKITVVKGTITQPSTGTNFTVPSITSRPKAFLVYADDDDFEALKQSATDDIKPVYFAGVVTFSNQIILTTPVGAVCVDTPTDSRPSLSFALNSVQVAAGFRINASHTNARFIGGIDYNWEAYDWEDDEYAI